MKKLLILLFLFFGIPSSFATSWTGDGLPLKYISSCELDLNKDGQADMVLLVESIQGRELIALIRLKDSGMKAYPLWSGPASNGMHLKCETNAGEIKATQAASAARPGKSYKTNGALIHLFKPESAQQSFFWEKSRFKSISTAD